MVTWAGVDFDNIYHAPLPIMIIKSVNQIEQNIIVMNLDGNIAGNIAYIYQIRKNNNPKRNEWIVTVFDMHFLILFNIGSFW